MSLSEQARAAAVGLHTELDRAPDLPWDYLKKPGCAYDLNAAQKETLRQIVWANGGVASLAVGQGKSLLAFIIPHLFGYKGEEVLFLHPKNLERTLLEQFKKFEPHFHLVMPRMISFEIFQNSTFARTFGKSDLENGYRPKCIIVDEAQGMKKRSGVRFRRVARYMVKSDFPVRFIPMTATISNREIEEYAHYIMLALKEGSPCPGGGQALTSWGRILNSHAEPLDHDWDYIQPLLDRYKSYGDNFNRRISRRNSPLIAPDEARKKKARYIYRKHLEQTPGMTIVGESSVASTLYLKQHKHIGIPEKLTKVLEYMEEHKRLPAQGDYFETPVAAAKARAEVLQGFYYKWVWKEGVSQGDITDWKLAKGDWGRAVYQWMHENNYEDIEAPAQLIYQIENSPSLVDKNLVTLYKTWAYHKKKTPPPETVGVWLDDYLIEWTDKWQKGRPPSLLWRGPIIVGRRLSEAIGIIHYDAGSPPPGEGEKHTGDHTAVISISHRQGLNLQAWRHHLIVSPPASGSVYEQVFGRSHRRGQTEDVRFDIVGHHPVFRQRLAKAKIDAIGSQEREGMQQKLLYGIWI